MYPNRALTFRWPLWAILVTTLALSAGAWFGPAIHGFLIAWTASSFASSWQWAPMALTVGSVVFMATVTALLFFFLLKTRSEDPSRERLAFLLPVFATVCLLVNPFAGEESDTAGSRALDRLAQMRTQGQPWTHETDVLNAIARHDTAAVQRFNALPASSLTPD
jgi:hypothetical protein